MLDVATLQVGDRVQTMQGEFEPVTFIAAHKADERDFAKFGHPILIKAGALGVNRPTQDLIVSPQHRVLVGAAMQLLGYSDEVVLVPAKAILGLPGIRSMSGKRRIQYHHFACARHAVVIANGAAAETLLPGKMVRSQLPRLKRLAFNMHIANGTVGTDPDYPCLSVGQARALFGMKRAQRREAA